MPRFTTANAREMAVKAHAARLQRLASGKLAGEILPQTPQMSLLQAGANPYVNARLSRVRRQLARLDDLLDSERDPQKIDRLASATARLAEQERQLAGRPLPGSLRPREQRSTRRRYADLGSLAIEASPVTERHNQLAAPAPAGDDEPSI